MTVDYLKAFKELQDFFQEECKQLNESIDVLDNNGTQKYYLVGRRHGIHAVINKFREIDLKLRIAEIKQLREYLDNDNK